MNEALLKVEWRVSSLNATGWLIVTGQGKGPGPRGLPEAQEGSGESWKGPAVSQTQEDASDVAKMQAPISRPPYGKASWWTAFPGEERKGEKHKFLKV